MKREEFKKRQETRLLERKLKEEEERKLKEEEDRKLKEEEDRKLKEEEEDRKLKEEEDRKLNEEEDRKLKEEEDRKLKEEEDRKRKREEFIKNFEKKQTDKLPQQINNQYFNKIYILSTKYTEKTAIYFYKYFKELNIDSEIIYSINPNINITQELINDISKDKIYLFFIGINHVPYDIYPILPKYKYIIY